MAAASAAGSSSSRQEVLIYLANETARLPREAANVARLVEWLESSELPSDRQLAFQVTEDGTYFPTIVDAELAAIQTLVAFDRGALIATNRLLHQRTVLLKRPGRAGFEPVPIELAAPTTSLTESSPLADLATLDAVLQTAAHEFNPTESEFVVVIHSHGDETYSLTPRVVLDSTKFTRETFLAHLHNAETEPTAFFDRAGITTTALLENLQAQHQRNGFNVSLLVLDSCSNVIDELPPSVRSALVSADGPLSHDAIDFKRILPAAATTSFSVALSSALVPSPFERIDQSSWLTPRWERRLRAGAYFVPLSLWIIGFVTWRIRRRRAPTTR